MSDTFDLRTHTTDPRTGKVSLTNPYRLHVINGVRYFERPVGSYNLWYENNIPAGRLKPAKEGSGEVERGVAHVEWKAPPTGAEKIAAELSSATAEAEALRKELAAIRAEQEHTIAKAQAAAPKPASTGGSHTKG
jgi:hypothetical protein